jgi:hypothetical protein
MWVKGFRDYIIKIHPIQNGYGGISRNIADKLALHQRRQVVLNIRKAATFGGEYGKAYAFAAVSGVGFYGGRGLCR